MVAKSLRYFLLTTFVVVLFASISMVGARANSGIDLTAEPTPATKKDKLQNNQPRIMVEQSSAPTGTGGPDAFGYEWDDSLPYNWIPISGSSTEVIFPNNNDDDVSNPISLGFSFPFYEKNYSSIYISTNGLLTFVVDEKSNSPSTAPLPFIKIPQALIAPFWDDLEVGLNGGKVYYQQLSSPERFVISYINVTRLDSDNDLLTFQVILDAGGDIIFQYESLLYDNTDGPLVSATVGIEDHDGVVGLTYLRNSDMAGLLHKAVLFTRPANTDHKPKALPLYQGAFTVNRVAILDLNVTNAGDIAQSFDLVVQNSDADWRVELFDSADTPITETPILAKGGEYPIKVKFTAPNDAVVGSATTMNLSVKSSIDSSAVWLVKIQSAVPASFVQSLRDSGDIDLRAISKYAFRRITVFPLYTGSTMGVQSLDETTFMSFWERNRNDGFITWSEIEQAVVNDFGADILNATSITNNEALASSAQYVFAKDPVSAITPDGNVAVVWVQKFNQLATGLTKSNIYMAVLDADDTTVVIKPPFPVTQNENWSYPNYSSPRISATPDNTFFVSWTEKTETESNIGIASFTSSGDPLLGAQLYSGLSSVPDVTLYDFSTVFGLANNYIVLGFSSYDKTSKIHTPGYAVLNTSGGTISSPVLLSNVEGAYPVVSQLVSGSIIYAWTKTETDNGSIISSQIAYALINPVSYIASPHLVLSTPDGIQGDYVSITPDEHGNAIFTWMDIDTERKLYYALVDPSGSLVTPTMSYYEVEAGRALRVNPVGRGNAFYIHRYGVYLPLTVR